MNLGRLLDKGSTDFSLIEVTSLDLSDSFLSNLLSAWSVFEPLKDSSFFSKVAVDPELETVVWPNGADLAPEFLKRHITKR